MIRNTLAAVACTLALFVVTSRVSAMLDAPGEAMAMVFATAMQAGPTIAAE